MIWCNKKNYSKNENILMVNPNCGSSTLARMDIWPKSISANSNPNLNPNPKA